MTEVLLEVNDLVKYFPVYGGVFYRQIAKVHAVDHVSFTIASGEVLGLVGESGCGKSTIGKTLLQLDRATSGSIRFMGFELTKASRASLLALRKDMQMIFQDPYESLNPRHSVGQILEEPFLIHSKLTESERRIAVINLLEKVGLSANIIHRYPHEFSGGQRQRIGIARAISQNPKLIICDESVSALDVSVQSQVINLLLDLQKNLNLAYLFISHDLAVVRHVSDRIAVMYLGKIVEVTDADTIYTAPRHPYTKALISAIPVPNPKIKGQKQVLQGEVPSPLNPPSGCHFRTRCPLVKEICHKKIPPLRKVKGNGEHQVACHLLQDAD